MKIGIIADIHGNAQALEAVLADIKSRTVDKVIVLGDICYRGPEPQSCIDLIHSLDCEVIKGNADEWVIRGVYQGEVPEQVLNMMRLEREWTLSKLDEESVIYLQKLPQDLKLNVNSIKIHAYHATPHSLFDVVPPNETEGNLISKMMDGEADIFVYAHIHKSYIRYINGKCIINTGSVGLPFDGCNKASYALVEIDDYNNVQTSIIRVDYDVEKVIDQFQLSNYPNKEFMINLLRNAKV